MSIYTSRGKLTIDATSDTTKITSIINYLKNTENAPVDVINGLGFSALNNRIEGKYSSQWIENTQ